MVNSQVIYHFGVFATSTLQFAEKYMIDLHRSDNSSTFAQRLLYNIGYVTDVADINIRYSAY